MVENGITDLDGLPWFPPPQRDLDPTEERLVPHVRDVIRGALAETLTERRDLKRSNESIPSRFAMAGDAQASGDRRVLVL